MPRFQWNTEPTELIWPFEAKHNVPDAGALLAWAARCVDELFYLDEIDSAFEQSEQIVGNHNPDLVDVAHVRWATGTAITAFDLCAAAFGRTYCGNTGSWEMAMIHFYPRVTKKKVTLSRNQLPAPVLRWIDEILADVDYLATKSARDWLTHSRVPRHFTVNTSGRQRLELSIDGNKIPVRQVIETARDVGARHIPALLSVLPQL
jgi:hypothetical protein